MKFFNLLNDCKIIFLFGEEGYLCIKNNINVNEIRNLDFIIKFIMDILLLVSRYFISKNKDFMLINMLIKLMDVI